MAPGGEASGSASRLAPMLETFSSSDPDQSETVSLSELSDGDFDGVGMTLAIVNHRTGTP